MREWQQTAEKDQALLGAVDLFQLRAEAAHNVKIAVRDIALLCLCNEKIGCTPIFSLDVGAIALDTS